MPEVSVIMPVYNGEQFLAESVESVLRQTFKDFELICINDGSTDRSQDIIDSFSDSRLKSIVQKNAGPPHARNTGIKSSKGNYLAFLDCDDVWLPFSLEKRLNYLSCSNERFMVHSDAILINESGKNLAGSIRTRNGESPFSGKCFRRLFLEGSNMLTSSVIIKKELFQHIGLFDESFFRAQDYDLWMRISYHYPISFLNEPLVKYRVHSNNISNMTMLGEIHSARALLKAAENVPDIEKLIGKSDLRSRLYQASFDVGYAALEAGDAETGRHWLGRAWTWGRKPKTFLLLAATACFGSLVSAFYSRRKSNGSISAVSYGS
jgi:glycosyltransferase involved in cell wall biosynthesis